MNGMFSLKKVCPKKPSMGVTWSRKEVLWLVMLTDCRGAWLICWVVRLRRERLRTTQVANEFILNGEEGIQCLEEERCPAHDGTTESALKEPSTCCTEKRALRCRNPSYTVESELEGRYELQTEC